MRLTDFIFLARVKIVVKPEAEKELELTQREIENIRKRGEQEIIGSTYKLKRDIFSILNPFNKKIEIWIGAIKNIDSILTGLLRLKTKNYDINSFGKRMFLSLFALPFRWALQAKHKMFWAFRKRQLHALLLSFGSHIKAAIIFVVMLFSKVALLFSAIIPIIKGVINKALQFISSYLGISLRTLAGYAAYGILVAAAIAEVFNLLNDTQKNYEKIVENTRTVNMIRLQDQLTDFNQTVTTYYKMQNTHDAALNITSQKYSFDLNYSFKMAKQFYNDKNISGIPGATSYSITDYGNSIIRAMEDVLISIFGRGSVSGGKGGRPIITRVQYAGIPPSDALHPIEYMEWHTNMARDFYNKIYQFYMDISIFILQLEQTLLVLMSNAKNVDKNTVTKWIRALNSLSSASLLFDHVVPFGTKQVTLMGLNLQSTESDINRIQKMTANMLEENNRLFASAPLLFGMGGTRKRQKGGSVVKNKEQLDKKTRRFRNLNIEIEGEIELQNNDKFSLDSFSEKLSKYLERNIKAEWS